MSQIERRQHARVACSGEVDLVANGATVRGRLLDVSLGGARMLVSSTSAQWGDSVQLLLRAGEPATSVAATVVRTQRTETGLALGLRFDSLPPESRRLVEALVAEPALSR